MCVWAIFLTCMVYIPDVYGSYLFYGLVVFLLCMGNILCVWIILFVCMGHILNVNESYSPCVWVI